MKVYLVQHAKAKSEVEDPQRPLSDEGRNDLKKLVSFLKNKNISVSLIYHSQKLRAKETALILSEAIKSEQGVKEIKGLNPDDDPEIICDMISMEKQDIVFVGHLPFMNNLANMLLTKSKDSDVVLFKQGSIACLEKEIEKNKFLLKFFIIPDIL
jgi:phosphohistidine phosphatase